MILKELYCNEYIVDFKCKDPDTYHKDRAKELRKLTKAEVEINGETKKRDIKVKSARPKKLQWDEYLELWVFKCKLKIEVINE